MTRIIDLDVVAPEDTIVIIDGEQYKLPGDIPVPHMLAIERAARDFFNDESPDNEALFGLQDEVLELFRVRQPDMEALPPLGIAGLIQFVQALYGPSEDVEPDPPKPARKGGTRSTTSRKTTRKASGS